MAAVPGVTITEEPVVNDVYAAIAVSVLTEAPVEKLPLVIVNTPVAIEAVAPEAEVTTVLDVTGVIVVVVPPVTTVFAST